MSANYKFCSCAGMRTEELDAFLKRQVPAGTALTSELLRQVHITFLKETAPRCAGGTNKGRCVTGCEPSFKREASERWPSQTAENEASLEA